MDDRHIPRSGSIPDFGQAVTERAEALHRDRRQPGSIRRGSAFGGSAGGGRSGDPTATGTPMTTAAVTYHRFYADATTVTGLDPAHLVNGARTAFDLYDGSDNFTPQAGSMILTLDGQVLVEGYSGCAWTYDYAISDYSIQFQSPPPARARIYGHCTVAEVEEA